jgi:hypothetical protein
LDLCVWFWCQLELIGLNMVWQLSGVWLCKRIWVCTLCGAPQVGPNLSQASYLLQSLYCGTCYWHSGLLSVEYFQFEVFAVVCVGPKWCYNIPISVGLKLWMHVLWWLVNVLFTLFNMLYGLLRKWQTTFQI